MDKVENENNKPTKKEQFELMLESILENFDNHKAHRENGEDVPYNAFGYISYDFLKNLGVISIDEQVKEILLEQAKEIALEELIDKRSSSKDSESQVKIDINAEIEDINNNGKQDRVMRICKNLGLLHYYDDILKNNLSLSSEIAKSMKKDGV